MCPFSAAHEVGGDRIHSQEGPTVFINMVSRGRQHIRNNRVINHILRFRLFIGYGDLLLSDTLIRFR